MLTSLIVLLFNTVTSRKDCDSSEISSTETICNSLTITPFINNGKACAILNGCCKPYSEFDFVTEFMTVIPNAKKIAPLYKTGDRKGLLKIATGAETTENYDAYNALFYNADVRINTPELKFDTNFIQFFLARFYYYLDILALYPTLQSRSNTLTDGKTGKSFCLLNLPSPFDEIIFGCNATALKLFNTILENTAINTTVKDFIRILLHQVNTSFINCAEKYPKNSCFNTYVIYASLLKQCLLMSNAVVVANTQYIEAFGTNAMSIPFYYVPYTRTTAAIIASPTNKNPTAAFLIPVDGTRYVDAATYDFLNRAY
ncbi:hypothetical protein GINT2_000976 [Glugoides intestinalis]